MGAVARARTGEIEGVNELRRWGEVQVVSFPAFLGCHGTHQSLVSVADILMVADVPTWTMLVCVKRRWC
jgi:hypothetical protein